MEVLDQLEGLKKRGSIEFYYSENFHELYCGRRLVDDNNKIRQGKNWMHRVFSFILLRVNQKVYWDLITFITDTLKLRRLLTEELINNPYLKYNTSSA